MVSQDIFKQVEDYGLFHYSTLSWFSSASLNTRRNNQDGPDPESSLNYFSIHLSIIFSIEGSIAYKISQRMVKNIDLCFPKGQDEVVKCLKENQFAVIEV